MDANPKIAQIKLRNEQTKRLTAAFMELKSADNTITRIKAVQSLTQVLRELGYIGASSPTTKQPTAIKAPAFDRSNIVLPVGKPRQKANDEAAALAEKIQAENLTRDDLSLAELEVLAKYTGSGGADLVDQEGVKGSAYEYYTPRPVANSIWSALEDMGFSGGRVLDPCAGTGVFAETSPASALVDSVELSPVSGTIARILNDGQGNSTVVSSFEKQAGLIDDNSMDAVVTNVPFGTNSSRGSNKNDDSFYQKESLEGYFILRSLDKLKFGGLAAFIVPTSVVSGKVADKKRLRKLTSLKASFLGAYRMPNKVFDETGADVTTDIIFFKKHSAEGTEKVDDLYRAGEMDVLKDSGVFWDEYLTGKYFIETGRKFILGNVEESKNRWGKMAERVESEQSTTAIAGMIKKFDGDRIDWSMLDAAEAEVIVYHNGDTVYQNGTQMVYQDGAWTAVKKGAVTDTEREIQDLLAHMDNAISMINAGVTFDQVQAVVKYSKDTGQRDLLPFRAMQLIDRAMTARPDDRNVSWLVALAAQGIKDAIALKDYGYNFKENEPVLTRYIKNAFLDAKNSKLSGDAKQDFNFVGLYYNKGKYNTAWRGEIDVNAAPASTAESYQSKLAKIQYENKSLYLSREQLASIHPEVDPVNDDNWFINADGSQVIAADDFMVGALSDRLADIDEQLKNATDDNIKAKLIKQKAIARENVTRIDVKRLDLDLRTPLISAEDKVAFLTEVVHKNAFVSFDANGVAVPDIDVKGSSTKDSLEKKDKDKLYNRMGDWLARGTVTLGSVKLEKMTQREALDWLTEMINVSNINFAAWVKANKRIMSQLESVVTNEDNLFFVQNADETPIDIAGMNPDLRLHGYQNAAVRGQGRSFGGINAMGVGLGKTFTALASTQHVQNIGVKKKTIFLVPNSVLSNWRKEARFAYQNTDDCIFIGLREVGEGEFTVTSGYYDEDLIEAIDGKYKKIFMTYEAFKRIRLKDDTIKGYADYIQANDSAFALQEKHKDNEKAKGLAGDLMKALEMNTNAPYLEDMRVDSVVIDEAHAFKNSVTAPNTDDRIKFLSQPKQSARGEDAQAKLWYIRSKSANKDGVLLLTATPITNSPLEIYSMLTLTSGRDVINKKAGGLGGADDFIKVMCEITEEVMPTIDGGERSQNVFTGIKNAQILRSMVQSTALIKDAGDVGMSVVIPDRDEKAVSVILGDTVTNALDQFQEAYGIARLIEKDDLPMELQSPTHPSSPFNPNSAYSTIKRRYDEDNELLAHPFNLIRKMDVIIADDEFSEMASFYDFNPQERAKVDEVIDSYNGLDAAEKRSRVSPYTAEDDYKANYVKDGKDLVFKDYSVTSRAKVVLHDGRERIVVDTLNGKNQARFESIADKQGLDLDVTISPKVAALLENVKSELAAPRGVNDDGTTSRIVKQIIFCDHLFLHSKIKRLLTKQAGIAAGKIAIITGQINNEPDQMIDVQDGFNAAGDDNKYQIIIANKKAEVGINLQKGTQAIHHLTTGWTPDSLEQRNGRGARQGNKTDKVAIFYYDADGTFDEFKRAMINKKDEWINSVLKDDGKNTIKVSGNISREEQDALMRAGSSKEAMREYQENRQQKEDEQRLEASLKRQAINLNIVSRQVELLANLSPDGIYESDVVGIIGLVKESAALFAKNQKSTAKPATKAKNEAIYEQIKAAAIERIDKMLSGIYLAKTETTNIGGKRTSEVIDKYKPEKNAVELYEHLVANASRFTPSRADLWHQTLFIFGLKSSKSSLTPEKSVMGRWISESVVFDENGIYQTQYEEKKESAASLINSAVSAVNYIADETGTDAKRIGLPADAGELIAERQAVIINDVYMQVGSIVKQNGKIHIAYMDDGDLYFMTMNELQGRADRSPYQKSTMSPSMLKPKESEVYLPNSDGYLDLVRECAAYEDKMNAQGFIKDDTEVYSTHIPIIAEYRDDSVIPKWNIDAQLKGTHAGITNGGINIMLPISILMGKDTPFSLKMKAEYDRQGIEIDYKDQTFTTPDDLVVTPNMYYKVGDYIENYYKVLADMIRNSGVKVGSDDIDIFSNIPLLTLLSNRNVNLLQDRIEGVKSSLTMESTDDDMMAAALKLYEGFVYNDAYVSEKPPQDTQIAIINMIATGMSSKRFDMMAELHSHVKSLKEIQASADANGGVAIKDEQKVLIGGNTKEHKKVIKDYGWTYGSTIRGGSKAYWNGRQSVWEISYSAYKKLIADRPALADELTMTPE